MGKNAASSIADSVRHEVVCSGSWTKGRTVYPILRTARDAALNRDRLKGNQRLVGRVLSAEASP